MLYNEILLGGCTGIGNRLLPIVQAFFEIEISDWFLDKIGGSDWLISKDALRFDQPILRFRIRCFYCLEV